MAPARLNTLALLALLVCGAVPLWATGGDYDIVPPSLDYFLERVPAKSVSQIYAEMGQAPSSAKPIELPRADLLRDFAQGPSPKLVASIDELLAKSRQPNAGAVQINLLQDLRDLAGNLQATGPEMTAYVQWRLDHLAAFQKGDPDDSDKPPAPADVTPDIEAQARKASKAMLPHWLYLEGARYYMSGDDTHSEIYFDSVLAQYPNDPRAESALFMKGRCKLSQSVKTDDYDTEDGTKNDAAKKDAAKVIFQSYLTKYPHGRYTSDVIGWLGGVAYRSSDPAAALGYYTQQLDMKDHPENFGSALVMIEKIMARQRPDDDATLDAIAQHPPVALALAYFALNFTQPKEDDENAVQGDYQTFNTWRHGVLPKLGQAVLKHKDLYQGAAWENRYLAILAHAASDHGDQKQALDLIAMGDNSKAANDDFLFAKALILQRAGKLAESEKTYRELLDKFPASPLARGARYRLALTLHDQKRDGEALLELAVLRGNHLSLRDPRAPAAPAADTDQDATDDGSALGIDYSGAPDEQVAETMDAILNFAPMPELEKALQSTNDKDHDEFRNDLSQVLQERYLDHDDFRQAARFTDAPQVQSTWKALADKADALQKASGPDAAEGCLEMADFWVENRKILPALPLDSIDTRTSLEFYADADTIRAANAALLSYPQPEQELESREGLWHAIKWWGQASATHDPVAAPTALWSIIKARRTIAEVNSYTWKRALDGQAGPDSKADYDVLVSKYGASPEAVKDAAYWSFPKNYPRSYYNRYSVGFDRDDVSSDWLSSLGLPAGSDSQYNNPTEYQNWNSIDEKIKGLEENAQNFNPPKFSQTVMELRDEVRKAADSIVDAATVNCLDDLVDLSRVDGVSTAVRVAYVNLRLELLYGSSADDAYAAYHKIDLTGIRQMSGTENIRDFIDFLDLAYTAQELIDVPVADLDKDGQPLTFSSRNYLGLLPKATAFLEKYPKSPKREAARLLQIRALVRASRPREVPWSIDWPAANQWDDEYAPRFLTLAPYDPTKVDAAFAAYSAEFPHGRYANAILALRADTALIQQKWGDALDDILALLDQQTAPELHNGAAGELSYIFDQLDKDERRQAVLAAVLQRPAARKDLAAYISTGSLAMLKDYLTAKLAIR